MEELLAKIAPLLGTAIAGPLGGVAASFIADKLGVSDKTVAAVSNALQSNSLTPDQVAQIKLAEIDFKKWMGDNAIKQDQLVFEDRKSARDMQIATKSYTPSILTWIVVFLCLGFEGAVLLGTVPPTVDNIVLGRVLGTLDSALIMVLSFWFGSSHGSQNKDIMLASTK